MLFLITLFTVVYGYAFRYRLYRIPYYHHNNLVVSEEQKQKILHKPLYYSIFKGIYELTLLLLFVICFFLYTFYDIPIYNLTTQEDTRQLKLLGILLIFILIMTFRLLQIVSYKIVISKDSLYIKTLLNEKVIPLTSIEKIEHVAFHYMLTIKGNFYPLYIPVGFSENHVLYRYIEDIADRNSLKIKKIK